METETFSKNIIFAVDQYPEGFTFGFESYIFNDPDFLRLRLPETPITFYALNLKKKQILARIHFFYKETKIVSSHRSPYGGLEINSAIDVAVLEKFIFFFEKKLKEKCLGIIEVKQFPMAFASSSVSKVANCFIRSGYAVSHPSLNHHIVVDKQSFEDKIHSMERRRLKKSLNRKWNFREESPNFLKEIYTFIANCRKEKSQALNMSFAEISSAMSTLPSVYKIFTLREDDELYAASIVVIVNKNILYNFLPGSRIKDKSWSPVVSLLSGLYDFCWTSGFKILDLGISAIENEPQYNLIKFKERVGGQSSLKFTFMKCVKDC